MTVTIVTNNDSNNKKKNGKAFQGPGCTANILWVYMETEHTDLMLHNKAEVQLLATVTLMRTEIILLQISIPTKLLQFPLKLPQF